MEETRAPYGPISETLKRGCTTSHYCQSYFSVRRGFISQSIFCCSEDLCNIVPYNVTYSTEHNGVECYSCISSLEECNETDMPSTQCRGKENHCVKISRQWLPDYVRRARIRAGCANQRLCQDTAFYGALMPKLPVSYMTCCQGPFCNREQGQGERRGKSALLALLAAPLLIALN
ncbi:urokinase plasminogen activator surface receptor-like [Rhineura floridana]|uniref:urokinase plasminogen activator surface receptor-like n=1 Tax=Rhineura floridana TaxID=261503 RepID=UPI002AC874E9|nr:urokinase plasminogen activator surface receptor-like [Rhineura floridana]